MSLLIRILRRRGPGVARGAALAGALAGALAAAPRDVAAQAGDTLTLSLPDAVALVLRADEVLLAAAQVDLADAQVLTARSGGLPQLRLNSTYQRTFASARGQAVGQLFNQPNTYTSTAQLSQSIFQGGRVFAASRAASRIRRAARYSAAEIRADATLAVQRAYLEALYAGRLSEIQRANYVLAQSRLAQVEQFQNAGRAARYDVLRARVERSNLEPALIQAEDDRQIALLELKRLLNIPPDRPLRLTTVVDTAAVQVVLASFGDTSIASERPSVRAAELVAMARRDGIRVARADLLPTITVSANFGFGAFPLHGFPNRAGRLDRIEEPCPSSGSTTNDSTCVRRVQNGGWFSDQSLAITVSWPLFDGLRTKGNIDLAQAQAQVAELLLRQEREAAALDVARARADFERARALYQARRENVGEAGEAFRLASLRFSRGLSAQLDVSDAQLAMLTAETNEARAIYDLYLATAELARALGRPMPLPVGAPPPATTTTLNTRAEP